MNGNVVTRDALIETIRSAVEPLPFVHAMWEAGSAAFGRLDEWSDLDVQVDADDEHVAKVFEAIEKSLEILSPIVVRYALPEPTWHGHSQRFYLLKDAPEHLVVDLVVLRHSKPEKFLETELHGTPLVYFDKPGVVRPQAVDHEALRGRLRDRVEALRVQFRLFSSLAAKEVRRGNALDALAFYHAFTLRPLVEMLRIVHTPARHGFYVRYARHDLPDELVRELTGLFFVTDAADLAVKCERAARLFRQAEEKARAALAIG